MSSLKTLKTKLVCVLTPHSAHLCFCARTCGWWTIQQKTVNGYTVDETEIPTQACVVHCFHCFKAATCLQPTLDYVLRVQGFQYIRMVLFIKKIKKKPGQCMVVRRVANQQTCSVQTIGNNYYVLNSTITSVC
jgi:hypothetical protein